MKKGFMTTLLLAPVPLTFQVHGFSCFSIIPQNSKSPAGTTLCLTDKKKRDDATQSPSWTLDEDWLLVDQLPKFTVGAGDQTRTFWTQLSAATPRLSSKGIPELLERCQVLQTNYTLQYGPSPPLLQNWGVDLSSVSSSSSSLSSSENNRAVGTLEDGRVIFLNYHVVGRLAGDSFQETTAAAAAPGLMAQIPGGYLEAVGGRIYELGEPRKSPGAVVVTREKPDSFRFLPFGSSSSILASDESTSGPVSARDMTWWLPSATSTISAMLAAAILSACIGYGAGLGIQGNSAAGGGGAAPTTPATEDIQVLHAKFSSSFSSSSSSTSPTDSGLSLEERKERAEYRIMIEQHVMQKWSEQLQRDQAEFRGLEKIQRMEQQQQQQQQQQAKAQSSNYLP